MALQIAYVSLARCVRNLYHMLYED